MEKAPEIRVLAVFANPTGTARLRLDTEERVIREAIELSKLRDNIVLHTRPAATIRDVSRAFLNETYHIVHIAGHGSGQGLILSNETGGHFLVNQSVLAELLQEYRESIQCVILNACYSFTQGSLLSQTIPFTIAMEYALDDRAAIKFSEGFYDAIAAGKSIETAYREGNRRIKFEIPGIMLLPQLMKQGEILPVQPEIKTTGRIIESVHLTTTNALIGVALDLSTSMRRSFHNQAGETIYRLESIRKAFQEFTQVARRGVQENQTENIPSSIDMFLYGFGLRSIDVCDLLALWKASSQIITKDRIESITEHYKQEQQNIYGGYKGLGNIMRDIGLGLAVDRFGDIAKQRAYTAIRRRIWHETKDEVEREVRNIGNITFSIDEMLAWWDQSADLLGNAEDQLFGNTTPIAETLTQIIARFEKELSIALPHQKSSFSPLSSRFVLDTLLRVQQSSLFSLLHSCPQEMDTIECIHRERFLVRHTKMSLSLHRRSLTQSGIRGGQSWEWDYVFKPDATSWRRCALPHQKSSFMPSAKHMLCRYPLPVQQ